MAQDAFEIAHLRLTHGILRERKRPSESPSRLFVAAELREHFGERPLCFERGRFPVVLDRLLQLELGGIELSEVVVRFRGCRRGQKRFFEGLSRL